MNAEFRPLPTFSAFRNGPVGTALATEPFDAQWAVYDAAMHERVDKMRSDPDLPVSAGQLMHYLALDVIESHLGSVWLDSHVGREAADNYLVPPSAGVQRLLVLNRIHALGRRLYEFQSYDWFGDALIRLRTRDLSGASFELDTIWLLMMAVSPVHVRVETGRKGEDYDLVAFIEGERVPVEMKTKEDETPFSPATVTNTVRKAAKQFPKGSQGVLFMRLPFAWVGPRLEEEYNEALSEGVRNTSRVGAVMSVIDKPHLGANGRTGQVTRHLIPFAAPDCHEATWQFLLNMRSFNEAGLHGMAPGAPF